jgi:hypothetical protein
MKSLRKQTTVINISMPWPFEETSNKEMQVPLPVDDTPSKEDFSIWPIPEEYTICKLRPAPQSADTKGLTEGHVLEYQAILLLHVLIKAITSCRSILGHSIEVKSQLWQDWQVNMPEQMEFHCSLPCPSESNLAHRHKERKHKRQYSSASLMLTTTTHKPTESTTIFSVARAMARNGGFH